MVNNGGEWGETGHSERNWSSICPRDPLYPVAKHESNGQVTFGSEKPFISPVGRRLYHGGMKAFLQNAQIFKTNQIFRNILLTYIHLDILHYVYLSNAGYN